jgi:mRNA interferase MazF
MYQPNDIILLPFPYTDLSAAKTRPAIVVSSETYLAHYPDLIVCYVSSQISAATGLLDYVLRDWKAAGLLKRSFVRPKLATVSRDLAVLKVGTLSDPDARALAAILRQALILGSFVTPRATSSG